MLARTGLERHHWGERMQNFLSNYSPELMEKEDFIAQFIRDISTGATNEPCPLLSLRDGHHCWPALWWQHIFSSWPSKVTANYFFFFLKNNRNHGGLIFQKLPWPWEKEEAFQKKVIMTKFKNRELTAFQPKRCFAAILGNLCRFLGSRKMQFSVRHLNLLH